MWVYPERGRGSHPIWQAGPPSNGPPMPDCGKKCNQCECTPLQTSCARKHMKEHQIAQHCSQLPEWGKKCNQCNVSVLTICVSLGTWNRLTKETPFTGQNVWFVLPKTTSIPPQSQRRVIGNQTMRRMHFGRCTVNVQVKIVQSNTDAFKVKWVKVTQMRSK